MGLGSASSADEGSEPLELGIRSLKERLEEILSRPKVSVADAEAAAEAARAIADLISAEQRVVRLFGRPDSSARQGRDRDDLAGLPLHEAARRLLQREGRPMHARELGAAILAGGWRHPRGGGGGDRIVFQLAARLGKNPDFVRWAPNTFALSQHGFREASKPRTRPKLPLFSAGAASPTAADLHERDHDIFDDPTNAPKG